MKLNWAERWAVNNPLRPWQQRLEVRWFKKRMSLAPGASILEAGCGRGAGAQLIREALQPKTLLATDLDPDMIAKARRYLPQEAWQTNAFAVADAACLPLADGQMDAVFGFGVLHHVPEWQAALAEIVRVLKPGGFYAFEELYPSLYQNPLTRHILLHPTKNRFRSADLRTALASAGLGLRDCCECRFLGILGVAVKR